MEAYEWAYPELWWLLLLLIPMVGWYIWSYRKSQAEVYVATIDGVENKTFQPFEWLRHALLLLRMGALVLLVLALSRPQSSSSWEDSTTEGIDIVIAVDISSSMLARDFEPNRLEASKELAVDFIQGRPNDRIGLVVFSGESFTQCPLTTDHAVLRNLFFDLKNGLIEDGTAIGSGLANSVSRLKNSDAISKVVILLTDGSNNRGSIPPLTAAEIAKSFGVRVYTIGVGTNGKAPIPVKDMFGQTRYQPMEVKIDEETLRSIAKMTGGQYFRATGNQELGEVYEEIDQLEKSRIEVTQYRRKTERFHWFAMGAVLLLVIEFFLRQTVFVSLT